ncbi:MAG: hypothetical protein U0V75_03090 [Ferruginibacter sp.]
MKRMCFMACLALLAAGCNNNTESKDAKPADAATTAAPAAKLDFPYTLKEPYKNWQPGDQQHALTVMKSLKGFETGDMAACMADFGDSVLVMFDGYRAKLSHDSLQKQFTAQRGGYSSIVITMSDWESVISADKKEEWVTLWYKQVETAKNGKVDSLSVVDDAKIENGKIVLLDEKIQHYPVKK